METIEITVIRINKEKSMKDGYEVKLLVNGLPARVYPKKKQDVINAFGLTESEFENLLNPKVLLSLQRFLA